MYKQNNRLRSKKRELKIAQTIFECSIRQIERMAGQEDPVMRYKLPIELFRISNDITLSIARMIFEESTENCIEDVLEEIYKGETSPELPERIEEEILNLREQTDKVTETVKRLQELMENFGTQFSHWVSTPHYAPEQLLGGAILDESKQEFQSLIE